MGWDSELAAVQAEHIPAHRAAPTGFEPGIRYDPATGVPTSFTTGLVGVDVQHTPGAWDDLVASLGLVLPSGYEARLVEAKHDPVAWTRDVQFVPIPGGDKQVTAPALTYPAWRYRFQIVPRVGDLTGVDLAELVAIARTNRPTPRRSKRTSQGLRVVVASDAQAGKVASGGGTPELLARVGSMLGQLDDVMRAEPCDESIVVDPGDITESFENVPAQQFTNDASHPDQLRLARALLTEIVTSVSARHRTARVVTVPSNHGAWRRGKNVLGRPGDDYGIDVHRAVAEALSRDRKFADVAFIIPEPWRESLAVQARGAILGVAHGHQAKRADKVADWWRGQGIGDGPLAAASILITGHFHSFLVEPVGAIAGRPRWHFQADPLDGGSDWWANLTGDVSEPSMMTFTIDDDGRWHNLRRITQQGLVSAP